MDIWVVFMGKIWNLQNVQNPCTRSSRNLDVLNVHVAAWCATIRPFHLRVVLRTSSLFKNHQRYRNELPLISKSTKSCFQNVNSKMVRCDSFMLKNGRLSSSCLKTCRLPVSQINQPHDEFQLARTYICHCWLLIKQPWKVAHVYTFYGKNINSVRFQW